MNSAKLDKLGYLGYLGSSAQVTWVSWVLQPNEASSKGFIALVTNPANPAK